MTQASSAGTLGSTHIHDGSTGSGPASKGSRIVCGVPFVEQLVRAPGGAVRVILEPDRA
jgi:hypothetical protein